MSANAPIAVIDTDVLFRPRCRAVILHAIQQGLLIGVWSPNIIAELFRIITVQWIAKYGSGRAPLDELSTGSKILLETLLGSLVLVDTGPRDDRNYPRLTDLDDLHLIAAGKLATASLIVSNNRRDFPAADDQVRHLYDGLEFVTYAELVARLSIDEAAALQDVT